MLLGTLSATHESNGDPASVSSGNGDLGGQSYGCYQFSSSAGIVDAFVAWLDHLPAPYGNYGSALLQAGGVNSESLIVFWKNIGTVDPVGFAQLQHDYTKAVYYDQAVQDLIDNFDIDINTRSEALQQVLWSRAVQYSAGNMLELFSDACKLADQDILAINDHDLIYNVYEVLIQDGNQAYQKDNGLWHSPDDWLNGDRDEIDGLLNRFNNERNEALAML